MTIGRRRAMFIDVAIGTVGLGITMVAQFPALLAGRLLLGVSLGLFTTITPRYIEETCPNHIYGSLGTLFVFSIACGNMTGFLWGEYLPDDHDTKGLHDTERWRVIFFYFPFSLYTLFALALIFSIKFEPIKYNITKNRIEEACYALRLMYKHCNEDNENLYVEKIRG